MCNLSGFKVPFFKFVPSISLRTPANTTTPSFAKRVARRKPNPVEHPVITTATPSDGRILNGKMNE